MKIAVRNEGSNEGGRDEDQPVGQRTVPAESFQTDSNPDVKQSRRDWHFPVENLYRLCHWIRRALQGPEIMDKPLESYKSRLACPVLWLLEGTS